TIIKYVINNVEQNSALTNFIVKIDNKIYGKIILQVSQGLIYVPCYNIYNNKMWSINPENMYMCDKFLHIYAYDVKHRTDNTYISTGHIIDHIKIPMVNDLYMNTPIGTITIKSKKIVPNYQDVNSWTDAQFNQFAL